MSKYKKPNQQQDKNDLLFGLPTPQLDGIPEPMRPICELGMKAQSDMLELWGHRARAWLDWPETFGSCKTLADLTKAQREYLGQMQSDYAHFTEGMLGRMMIDQNALDVEESKVPDEQTAPEDTPLQKVAA